MTINRMLYKLFLLFCPYLPFQIALNPSEGIDLASGRIFILILALLWLISGLKDRQIFVPARIQTWLILSFLFISGFSLFWVQNIDWGLRKFLFLLSIFPVYFVASGLVKSGVIASGAKQSQNNIVTSMKNGIATATSWPRNDITIIKFLVWGAGLTAIIGIIQFLLQFIVGLDRTAGIWRNYVTPLVLGKSFSQAVLEYPSWLVNISGKDFLRTFSTFPDPHMLSFYLGLTLPLAIGLYYLKRGSTSLNQNGPKRSNLDGSNIYLIFSIIILLANLLTFSRGGYVGLATGLIFIVLYFAVNKKISAKKLLTSLVLTLIILASLAATPVGKRALTSFSASEGSNKVRFENWNQAVEVIKNNPLGVGIGNYSYEIEPSAPYRKPIYAHNLYLDIAAETGVVNSCILILLIIFSIRSFIVRLKSPSDPPLEKRESKGDLKLIYLGGAVSIVIFSVHSIFDTALYSVQVLPLLLIIIALSASE